MRDRVGFAGSNPPFPRSTGPHGKERGWTLVELVIASALIGILLLTIGGLFTKLNQSISLADARDQMKSTTNAAVESLQRSLPSGFRIFGNDVLNQPFVDRCVLSLDPAPMPDFVPVTVVSWLEDTSPWGNLLMFLTRETSLDVSVGTETVRVDVMRFYVYYVAFGSGTLMARGERNLHLWKSHPYVNKDHLDALSGPLQTGVISSLYAQGLRFAFLPGSTTLTASFHALDAGGNMTVEFNHLVQTERNICLTQKTNRTVGSYRQALAPNLPMLAGYKYKIPINFTPPPNGENPSGFEVTVKGHPQERRVWVRVVLVAQGNFPSPQMHEVVTTITTRDVW